MMIGTRCRISFFQFIPKKPTRFTIKVWVCAEASSGYVLDFQVYTGASDEKMDKRVSLGHKVVMKLMEPLQGKGHSFYRQFLHESFSIAWFTWFGNLLCWHCMNKQKKLSTWPEARQNTCHWFFSVCNMQARNTYCCLAAGSERCLPNEYYA